MSSEEIEPDAWATFSDTYRVMDDLDADEQYVRVRDDTHKEPLYSAETIKQLIKDKRQEFNNGRDSEYPQKILTELLEEVDQS